ncbi:MAG: caspase family protein [Bacteroidaceae bacterium]|nr:caspase family protein [Bacteroidaceae bacterium]
MKHSFYAGSLYLGKFIEKVISKRICLSLVFIGTVVCLNAGTIHWITFFNTDDPNVGALDKTAKDFLYEKVITAVSAEVQQHGCGCKIYDFYSGAFSTENCKNVIANLQCDSTDVIFFYYVGHGGRNSDDFERYKYPLMMFEEQANKAIPMSWIHQSLKDKGARLTLTFAVCSNTLFGFEGNPEIDDVLIPSLQKSQETPSSETSYPSSLVSAFLGYRGDLIVCSASPGQSSWGAKTPAGGMDVFTYVFASTLENKKGQGTFSWSSFLEEISTTTTLSTKEMPAHGTQTPIFDYSIIQTAK